MRDNGAAFAALDAAIRGARKLGNIAKDVAPAVARELRTELLANIAAQRGPDGKAWPPGAGGKPVLQGAGKALDVRAVGTVVVAALTGPEALHHMGAARGGIARPILPTTRIPAPVTAAIARVVAQHAARTLQGGA